LSIANIANSQGSRNKWESGWRIVSGHNQVCGAVCQEAFSYT
jgi:hypothetical protein